MADPVLKLDPGGRQDLSAFRPHAGTCPAGASQILGPEQQSGRLTDVRLTCPLHASPGARLASEQTGHVGSSGWAEGVEGPCRILPTQDTVDTSLTSHLHAPGFWSTSWVPPPPRSPRQTGVSTGLEMSSQL